MPTPPTILVFDSGLGGLTVLREVVKLRPDARYAYVADDAFFPYNGRGEAGLVARVVALMGGLSTDWTVLACTHYPLLLERMGRLAPWPVTFIDPAPAIARRVTDLIGPKADAGAPVRGRIAFTSGTPPPPPLAAALSRFGIG